MSKKVNPEEKIVTFFTETPLPAATVVFNIVNGIIKKRKAAEQEQEAVPAPKKRRKARKAKAAAVASASAGTSSTDQGDESEE